MQQRPLGQTDTRVSVICLGTMTYGEQNTSQEAEEQMNAATEAGVNFFDTAEMYAVPPRPETCNRTEEIIGDWLKKRGKRDDLIIATKIAGPSGMAQPSSPPPLSWIRGGKSRHNKQNISEALNGSLRRLQTDYIDLYQLHWPDRNTTFFGQANYQHVAEQEQLTPLQETLEALAEHVKAGKIRHIGLSNESPWGLMQCLQLANSLGLPRVVSVQNPYNLLNRTYEIGMAEISAREQCGLLPYSPLAFGALSGKYLDGMPANARMTLFPMFKRYLTPQGVAATAAYAALAKKHGMDLAQLAIAFTICQPFVTSSIIGATTMAQLKSDLAAASIVIDDSLRAELEAIGAEHFNPCP